MNWFENSFRVAVFRSLHNFQDLSNCKEDKKGSKQILSKDFLQISHNTFFSEEINIS